MLMPFQKYIFYIFKSPIFIKIRPGDRATMALVEALPLLGWQPHFQHCPMGFWRWRLTGDHFYTHWAAMVIRKPALGHAMQPLPECLHTELAAKRLQEIRKQRIFNIKKNLILFFFKKYFFIKKKNSRIHKLTLNSQNLELRIVTNQPLSSAPSMKPWTWKLKTDWLSGTAAPDS